ncbi:hypothetical protein IY804_04765, partial [Campylobacter volucris]|nr:hypothetical protein [Campylobacter volucris]
GSLAVEMFGLKKSGYFDRANENYEDYSQHETILDDWKFDQPFGKYAWTTQTGIYE